MHTLPTPTPLNDAPVLVETLAHALMSRGWLMATAESCTGGLIAAQCTELPGSSRWFDRGFVTYSNAAKSELLGIPSQLIAQHGAVSEAVARAMAEGACQRAGVHAAVAVTGVAGPDGGSPDKPVGTVWVGWCVGHTVGAVRLNLDGNRAAIRHATVQHALSLLLRALD